MKRKREGKRRKKKGEKRESEKNEREKGNEKIVEKGVTIRRNV